MLDQRHLQRGLDALCRAHRTNFFFDGHKGGALISATYFCREAGVEKGVSELIEKRIDAAWTKNPVFAPFPKEKAAPARLSDVKQKLVGQCCTLRRAAHNWILASLALRVLTELPELATPKRLAGLDALIGKFDKSTVVPGSDLISVPHPKDADKYSRFILTEFAATAERFDGRGQGWSGHLCTLGQALLDMQNHGHADLVDEALRVMQVYVRRVRLGPGAGDKPRGEKSSTHPSPLGVAYWKKARVNFALAHAFKYPYGFFGLLRNVKDQAFTKRALATFWRISASAAS